MSAAISIAISLWLLAATTAAAAPACRDMLFEDAGFTVCTADPATDDIRLALNDPGGAPIGTFERLAATATEAGREVVFAMNGGMYHPDLQPVGLYVEDGREMARLVTREGPGNFGMLPNGVLCLAGGGARILESRRFAEDRPECRFATQSGPMLVIDGALHPRFLATSESRNIRNGVGVTTDGLLVAAISDTPVNFHTFARFFRDALGAPNALFLDGRVSRLYAPGMGRADIGWPMGPILLATRPAD